jgi:hypothetical protein
MTLFVTPVMYSVLNSRHDKKRAKHAVEFSIERDEKIQALAGGAK